MRLGMLVVLKRVDRAILSGDQKYVIGEPVD